MNLARWSVLALMSLGCGSPIPTDHSGHSTADAGVEDPFDAGIDAGTPDAGQALPGVPVLISVAVVSHSMSISWQLPSSGCGSVSLRMKAPGGAYAAVRTLAGVTNSTSYSPGHSSGTYCFQVTCTLGGAESAPSNELCATQ